MKWVIRLFLTSLISIALAYGLSFLPQLERTGVEGHDASVTKQEIIDLNDQNLVDYIGALPLHLELLKVNWIHATLVMEMKLDSSKPYVSDIFRDLYVIANFGFSRTKNVDHVLVRVMDVASGRLQSGVLLLAMEADRNGWSALEEIQSQHSENSLKQLLESNFRLTYTKSWRNVEPSAENV